MATTKYDIEKFTGKNDFALQKMKMETVLIHQGLGKALLLAQEPSVNTSDKQKEGFIKKAEEISQKVHSAIILTLFDQVLRKVTHEKVVAEMEETI